MKVTYSDPLWKRLETDEAANTGLPIGVIKSAVRKIQYLRAATDERDLRNWKSLHYEKLQGDREGQRSIRLNKQWRLIFTLDNDDEDRVICIVGIEDYH